MVGRDCRLYLGFTLKAHLMVISCQHTNGIDVIRRGLGIRGIPPDSCESNGIEHGHYDDSLVYTDQGFQNWGSPFLVATQNPKPKTHHKVCSMLRSIVGS